MTLKRDQEDQNLRSQFVTSNGPGRGKFSKYLPFAFTEHGVTMLASVVRSERAVTMNVAIVRAFIALRKLGMHYEELAAKIKELEIRYDKQFSDIYQYSRPCRKINSNWKILRTGNELALKFVNECHVFLQKIEKFNLLI